MQISKNNSQAHIDIDRLHIYLHQRVDWTYICTYQRSQKGKSTFTHSHTIIFHIHFSQIHFIHIFHIHISIHTLTYNYFPHTQFANTFHTYISHTIHTLTCNYFSHIEFTNTFHTYISRTYFRSHVDIQLFFTYVSSKYISHIYISYICFHPQVDNNYFQHIEFANTFHTYFTYVFPFTHWRTIVFHICISQIYFTQVF